MVTDNYERVTPTVLKLILRYQYKPDYCVYPVHINITTFQGILMSKDKYTSLVSLINEYVTDVLLFIFYDENYE